MAADLSQSNVTAAVLTIVTAAARPMSAAAVYRLRKTVTLKATKPAIESALVELAEARRMCSHPPTKTGGPALFHRLSPLDYTVQRITTALVGDQRLSARVIRKVAGTPYAPLVDEALARLAADGRVRPTRFLSARQITQLTSIAEAVNSLRPTPISWASLLAFLDGTGPSVPPMDDELTDSQMVQWYTDDLARLGGLRAVPIPWTWEHYTSWCSSQSCRPNADLFKRRLLEMAARAAIGLTPHEHEGRLDPGVLDILPGTPAGYRAYYWTVLRGA